MKQKDVAMIIIVVFVSGIISFVVSGKFFVASNVKQKVETVDTLSSDFANPDPLYFNKNSIDPTQLIHIGTGSNPNPFNGQ
jgi:hypothetical protein